ncbi:MAG: hypothetical protein P8H06_05640 [Luminiphilus sp.]|nr:hypothetical protein [Luminiphilus sp.]
MRRLSTTVLVTLSLCFLLPAAALPRDALINNTLSLPGEMKKSVLLAHELADVRGAVWPLIFGIATVDLALQAYYFGVYIPKTRGGRG